MTICRATVCFALAVLSPMLKAAENEERLSANNNQEYSRFGFGPALFMINYDEEVLDDTKDVVLRGNGTISSTGSSYNAMLGLEVHYDISIPGLSWRFKPEGADDWQTSRGVVASPFAGIYDIEDGIKGLAVGVMLGIWKGDGNFANRRSLNVGLGYTVHRDQLVLSGEVREGAPPPTGFVADDYTTRTDVEGYLMSISVSVDF